VERPDNIPSAPGVYIFRDEKNLPIYIGKAVNLKSRIASYFNAPNEPRIQTMMRRAQCLDWIVLNNETEALLTEQSLIKQYKPAFNVLLKDDKSYPWIAIGVNDYWPQAKIYRGRLKKGVKYFGPYAHAYSARKILELLETLFPIRSCSDGKFKRYQRLGKPCLLYHIKRCSGPCINAIERDIYLKYIDSIIQVLSGKGETLTKHLKDKMIQASKELNYESAAYYRDRLVALEQILESQSVITTSKQDFDVLAVAMNIAGVSVQIFHVKSGHLVGTSAFSMDPLNADLKEILQNVIEQVYLGEDLQVIRDIPERIYTQLLPESRALLEKLLSEKRGKKVQIKTVTAAKQPLLNAALANADDLLMRIKLKREKDVVERSKALNEIQNYLGLKKAPYLIECYDASHLAGSFYVGSMVLFQDGLAKKSGYKRFKLKLSQNDDYLAIKELLTRRFKNIGSSSSSLNYLPDLVLIDGGKGQLHIAQEVLASFNLLQSVEVAAIAKQYEYIYVPNKDREIELPLNSSALFLLKLARDEAHRFAIGYNRKLRQKAMTESVLDEIYGIGPKRKKKLLTEFGSLQAIKKATVEDISQKGKIPLDVAKSIKESL